ncbi:MAG: glycosyltransferase family 2 protein [Parcubacteria group bacterium]|nr:MAG: glycosyltransferase family 2 protein [Parcubacteria group bacterium]
MHLSIIIPAYNEEKRITKTLEEIDRYISKQAYDYEIIVASDGSKDRTADVVKNLASRIKNLTCIDDKENHGKGYAVRQGLLAAKGDFRLFTDADNSTSIDQVEKMWPEVKNGYDIVIGSRDIKGAVLDPPQPWIRNIILGEGFKLFRKIVIGLWGVEDTQCGFKLLTKKAAENILPKCKIDRFAFDPEILVIGKKMGLKIKEIPVYWKNDLDSKVKMVSMVKMALDLFVIRKNSITGVYK